MQCSDAVQMYSLRDEQWGKRLVSSLNKELGCYAHMTRTCAVALIGIDTNAECWLYAGCYYMDYPNLF